MRDLWYADNRDLVKWGVLAELASRHGVRHILQALYYRPTVWSDLEINGQAVKLPESVIRHFRNALAIGGLQCSATVEAIPDTLVDRNAYLQILVERVQSRSESPCIVFLDPDTGLEPKSPGLEHVLESELLAIWRAMAVGDVLVLYQHQTNMSGEPWIEPKREQFERALALEAGCAGLARGPKIASDVVFFFAQKARDVSPPSVPHVDELGRTLEATPTVQQILDCLNRAKTRATYGAVADLIGGLPRSVGQRLGARRPEASWVVSGASGLPSGYAPEELHPDLTDSPLIISGGELRALLKRDAG